ncbi:Uncharacterised protein [Mycobacteroides abscessus subsp. abscessus]|nr:Uncharacterised protein [Mycobacteroides abscessus subsp. abscessus]
MADAQPGRPSGEAAVGDEEDVLADARALDRTGDREHLAHARPALGAFVADDDDVTLLQFAVQHRVHRRLFLVEDPGRAFEDVGVEARGLDDGALGGERAAEHGESAGRVDRVVERPEDLAVGVGRVDLGEVLGHGPARHGEAVAVEETGVEEGLHDHGHAADLEHVVHHVFAEGLDVAEVGNLVPDPVEVVEFEVDAGFGGDREEVEDGVRRPAEGHDDGDRVVQRLLRDDVLRSDALAQEVDDGLTGLAGVDRAVAVDRRRGGGAGQGHAHRLGGRGHRVRRVHSAARAFTGTHGTFDGVDVLA